MRGGATKLSFHLAAILTCCTVGGVSAAVSKTAAAPIERVKLLIQNQVCSCHLPYLYVNRPWLPGPGVKLAGLVLASRLSRQASAIGAWDGLEIGESETANPPLG